MSTEANDERAVIGCALNGAPIGVTMLTDEDYSDPANAMIASAILTLLQRDIGVEVITVADELERRGQLRQVGGQIGLHDLAEVGHNYVGLNAPYFATEVRNAARVRRIALAAQELTANANSTMAGEYTDEIISKFRQQLDNLPPEMGGTPDTSEDHWARTYRLRPDEPNQWLVPGLLDRNDRVMVTGLEGFGKSAFVMQVAGCVAAGLNPFNGARVSDGHRVLTFDCENPLKRVSGGIRFLAGRIENRLYAQGWDERWTIRRYPAGLNLLGAKDITLINDIANRVEPDLIVIGPIYKLMRGDPNKDSDMLQIFAALDDLRVRHSAALIIEAHSPLATGGNERPVRPMGSSVQLRWPEIGFGIRPDESDDVKEERIEYSARHNNRVTHMECVAWRGQREDRDWPTHIKYGTPQQLPWVPTDKTWHPSVDLGYEIQPRLPKGREQ